MNNTNETPNTEIPESNTGRKNKGKYIGIAYYILSVILGTGNLFLGSITVGFAAAVFFAAGLVSLFAEKQKEKLSLEGMTLGRMLGYTLGAAAVTVGASIVVSALTQKTYLPFFSLYYAAVGSVLVYSLKMKVRRTSVCVRCAVVIFMLLLSDTVLSLAVTGALDNLSIAGIREFFSADIKETVKTLYTEIGFAEYVEQIIKNSGMQAEAGVIIDEIFDAFITLMVSVLPGVLISAMALWGYISTFVLKIALKLTGTGSLLTKDAGRLAPSVVSAYLFIGVNIVNLFTASVQISYLSIIVLNLVIILTLPFTYAGIRQIKYMLKNGRTKGFAVILIVGIAFALFTGALYALSLVALIGAFATVKEHNVMKMLRNR